MTLAHQIEIINKKIEIIKKIGMFLQSTMSKMKKKSVEGFLTTDLSWQWKGSVN